jgi:hypothetical protein
LVTISPSDLITMPEPDPAPCGVTTPIFTTDGSMIAAAFWTDPSGAADVGAAPLCVSGAVTEPALDDGSSVRAE